jgi:hypothetical protein
MKAVNCAKKIPKTQVERLIGKKLQKEMNRDERNT